MSIDIQNICKQFGAFTALNDVSLHIPEGELVALLGPSGCGKTSLLRIIAGLDHADSGRIALHGQDRTDQHIKHRGVGFVFQHYALFRHMTIFENVAFGLRAKPRRQRPSTRAIREKVDQLLELVQLGWLGDRYPDQLSGGQRQRIALARALAVEPRVLLLDEPFGALDANVRKDLRRWLRNLHRNLDVTSLFVTHDQEEAMEVASRIVVMNNGRVEQTGSPASVYEHPATPFVSRFMGSVNLFQGRVRDGRIDLGHWQLPLAEPCADTDAITVFVRPHEAELTRRDDAGLPEVRVQHIIPVGSVARLELKLAGDTGDQPIQVEIPQRECETMSIANGDRLFLRLLRVRLFPAGAAS